MKCCVQRVVSHVDMLYVCLCVCVTQFRKLKKKKTESPTTTSNGRIIIHDKKWTKKTREKREAEKEKEKKENNSWAKEIQSVYFWSLVFGV